MNVRKYWALERKGQLKGPQISLRRNWSDFVVLLIPLLRPSHIATFQIYTLDKFYWLKEAMEVHVLTSLNLKNGCFDSSNILVSCAKVQQTW